MAFKWVQCLYCFHTKNIDRFPKEVKKKAGRLGYCICIKCLDDDAATFSRLRLHGAEFFEFIRGEQHDQSS